MRVRRLVAIRRRSMCSLICMASVAGIMCVGTGASASIVRHAKVLQAMTCTSTTPISAGPSPLASAIVDPSVPQCFTFEDNGGDTIFVNAVATSTNPSPTVEVVDPEGNPLSSGCCDSYSTDVTGVYTIEVTDTSIGPFDVVLQELSNPVGCTTITLGDPAVSSMIAEPGGFVCLQFVVSNQQWVESFLNAAFGPIFLDFFGPNGSGHPSYGLVVGGSAGASYESGFGVQTLLLFADGHQSPATGPVTITLGELDLGDNSSGPAGTELQLFGDGFTPGERFKVTYRTGLSSPIHVVICQGFVSRGRQPECEGHIPRKTHAGALGPHEIVMTGESSGHVAKFSFDLTRRHAM